MASWITLRDQVSFTSFCCLRLLAYELIRSPTSIQLFSPLAQGVMWGLLTIAMSTFSGGLHKALYPASYVPRGRVTGGPGGKTGGGEIVGSSQKGGYWRGFVRSIFGGFETAAV